MVCAVSERIIVDDEKQAAIASSKMDIVSDELERYGSYSRTFHYLTNGFRNSADLRIRRAGKCLFGTIFSNTESIDRDWMTDTFSRTGFIKAAMEFLEKPRILQSILSAIRILKASKPSMIFSASRPAIWLFSMRRIISMRFLLPNSFAVLKMTILYFLQKELR